jgi:hypothetical protein
MFLHQWNHLTGRKGRELPYFMLILVAGWVLLEFDLPGARAQVPMMGGMIMWPPPPTTMRLMNANGMGYSGAGTAYSGSAMFGGYLGGPYGSQGGYVNRGSTESPLPRSLDGYIDGSSTSSSADTSGSRSSHADSDRRYGSQDRQAKGSSRESPLPRSLDGYIDGNSTSSYGTSRSRNSYADGDRRSGSQDGQAKGSSRESPLPRSLDGYIDGGSTSSSYRPSRSRNDHTDGKPYQEKLTTWVPLILP